MDLLAGAGLICPRRSCGRPSVRWHLETTSTFGAQPLTGACLARFLARFVIPIQVSR